MTEPEVPLSGGNVTEVVRVGNTVRRTPRFWTPTVHHFLSYLQERGFTAAPQPLGFDSAGREILTYIRGEVGHYPLASYMWSDETLERVARLMGRFHSISADYVPPAGALWQLVYPDPARHEVICHNDFAPYNMVFERGEPKALIDWDVAGPGPRLWDIAYAVYRFVPLSWEPDIEALRLSDPAAQSRRLSLFSDAYGLSVAERGELLNMVRMRLEYLCTHMVTRATAGEQAFRKMIEDGHLALYHRDIEALQRQGPLLDF